MCNAARAQPSGNVPVHPPNELVVLTAKSSSVVTRNVAEVTLEILSPFQYPGAPLSIDYLENLCQVNSRHYWGGTHLRHDCREFQWGRKEARSCADSRNDARVEVQGYMSQRNPASGPPSNAPRPESQSLPPLSPLLSRPQSSQNARPGSPYHSQAAADTSRTTLAPLVSVNPSNRLPPLLTDAAPSRSLGVHSILNPSYHDRPTTLQTEPTASSGRPASPPPTTATLPPVARRPSQVSPTAEEVRSAGARTDRRILTPKSPIWRASGAGGRRSYPLGPFESPLMRAESRIYTAEPVPRRASEITALPLPAPVGRPANPFASLTEPSPGPARRPSGSRNPFTASAAQAQGESPSTSHSSYSHFSQSSPVLRYGQSSQNPSSLHAGPGRQPVSLPPGQSSAAGLSEGQYDMNKGSYGISIPTEGGQMLLPVELDVEQASKTANEKRKRNAGASARFRQRRKEKEREASQTIANLERELHAVEDERNHYRSERDFFRDLYARQVGPGQLSQRPLTPRAPAAMARPALVDTSPQWQDLSRETSESLPRNLRHRTSSYSAAFPAPPPPAAAAAAAQPMLPPQAQSFGFAPQQGAPVLQSPFPSQQGAPVLQNPFPSPQQGAPVLQNPFPPQQGAPVLQNPFPPPQQGGPVLQSPFPPPRAPASLTFPPQPAPSSRSSSSQDPFRRDMYSRSWNPGP